ncbi:MAG: nucleotidyltransferase [Bacteroidales bacterium]
MPYTYLTDALTHPIFPLVRQIADTQGVDAYVIGGFVRDYLLHRKKEEQDIDIVVIGNGLALAQEVAQQIGENAHLSIFKNFGTAMLHYEGCEIEFVGARKESYQENSRKPAVENGTLEEDQNRRDFTINAMAICLNQVRYGELLDPFHGMDDLAACILRTPLDPDLTFSDDPLRMLRAIRFASQLYFDIENESFEAIQRNVPRLHILSQERIAEEFNKIILSPRPSYGFKLLDVSGILNELFPELVKLKGIEVKNGKAHKDNFEHTLEVLDNISLVSNDLWIRWAALLHDIAKPQTKRFDSSQGWTFHGHESMGAKMVEPIFKRFKLPQNEKMRFVQKMVFLHLRPIILAEEIVSDSAVRRLLFEAGEDIEPLMQLCRADITSKNREKVKKYQGNFTLVEQKLKDIEAKDHVRNFQPPVSGEDIMAYFNLGPCHEIGIIKTAIKEAILDGIIPNERTEALQIMLQEAQKLNFKLVKPL